MFDEVRKIPIFIVRDFRMLATYKLAFSMSFLSVIFNLFYFVLFGSMFTGTAVSLPVPTGQDYIYYLLVGSIGWGFFWSIMNATAQSLRMEMMRGTLESLLLTSTKVMTIMLSYAIFGSFLGLISIVILFGAGTIIYGITVFAGATIYTVLIFFLSSAMMMGFGMIFGGLTIWLKNIGETVTFLQNTVMFFCGVYFPIAVLPTYLQPVSQVIPFYYSIEGLRRSLLPDTAESELIYYSVVLLGLAIAFLLLGGIILYKGLNKARRDGSLSHY